MNRIQGDRPTAADGDRPTGGNGRTPQPREMIAVRCPNPACGQQYNVPAEYAGRRARCSACTSVTTVPGVPQPGPAAPGPAATADGPEGREDRPEVRIGCVGRGHAGKTALFQALGDGLIGDFLPSGLHLDAADPREVARMIRESEHAQRLLQKSGLPPTVEVSQTQYCLYQGDEPRVDCRLREVIGQVLTHTLPDSDEKLQAQYTDYLKSLVNAHVLWVVVPCPPASPAPRDRRRYSNDLRITVAYVREALRLRTAGEPVAVAFVLSKTDALFASADEARAALSDDVLRRALGPLVNLVEQSGRVADAAIFPVSAFGFGKAVLRSDGGERTGTAPGSAEEPFGDEPIWLLREDELPEPHNLDSLFLWSVLMGLLNQPGAGPEGPHGLETACRMLRDDLEAGNPWLVPVKGGVALSVA